MYHSAILLSRVDHFFVSSGWLVDDVYVRIFPGCSLLCRFLSLCGLREERERNLLVRRLPFCACFLSLFLLLFFRCAMEDVYVGIFPLACCTASRVATFLPAYLVLHITCRELVRLVAAALFGSTEIFALSVVAVTLIPC